MGEMLCLRFRHNPREETTNGEVFPNTPPAPMPIAVGEFNEDGLPSNIQLGLQEPEHLWSPAEDEEEELFWLIDDTDFLFRPIIYYE